MRSFEEIGRTYLPDGNIWSAVDVELLSEVPVVSAVLGSVAGLPAINACLAHFNLMLKDKSHLFPGGPPVVKAALGYDISKEDLGGDKIHVRKSGSIDNLAVDEEDAFRQIRRFLSYLPSNVHDLAPREESDDPVERREASLIELVPKDPRKVYNARHIIEAGARPGQLLRDCAALRQGTLPWPGAPERLSRRRDGQQSHAQRRYHGRCRGQQGGASDPIV